MQYTALDGRDFMQLIALEQRYKASIGEPALDDRQAADLRHAIQTQKIFFFVAKDGDRVIGMCSVSLIFSTFSCGLSGVFEDFYIDEAYRHQGIARGLTGHVFQALKAQNVSTLWVGCADVDSGMYRALGFAAPLGNLLAWGAEA